MNRRHFLGAASTGLAALHVQARTGYGLTALPRTGVKGVGICDWNMGEYPNPDLIPVAREAHLEEIGRAHV